MERPWELKVVCGADETDKGFAATNNSDDGDFLGSGTTHYAAERSWELEVVCGSDETNRAFAATAAAAMAASDLPRFLLRESRAPATFSFALRFHAMMM
ncbi:unnamed protein product [Sphagnum jensenii]|jgi:hypothetical protein|uniref:Uncharacterized protein n=2 Tax=Sphagnum jensenii TaxID=128206 RepID=A0ABP1B629_9BRYO